MMANLTSTLIRREPPGRLRKTVARIEVKSDGQEVQASSVTEAEIQSNIKGAHSFVDAVMEIKRYLGLPSIP